ncbi:hypothetical protein GGS23DRAFT_589124 [Durotheca rogersii]|uniref:uncharacterized protein n=1 Tax=Durotheca rogersii TaxID=419775 RepID=UPI00221EAD5F|nr:uncharacterized protein GGS23DRAFT_589124 [Durotheca rogersii]KAI5856189.1 hypothetical protein GGS23DRAFT_589124 [Durotheca rogersii]
MEDNPVPTPTSHSDNKAKLHKKSKRRREIDVTEGAERRHKKRKRSEDVPPTGNGAPDEAQVEPSEAPTIPKLEVETEDHVSKAEKKRRKAKQDRVAQTIGAADDLAESKKKSKKKENKKKERDKEGAGENGLGKPDAEINAELYTGEGEQQGVILNSDTLKDANKPKKRRKKASSSRKIAGSPGQEAPAPDSEPMGIRSSPAKGSGLGGLGQKPDGDIYPFFAQTVSQYLPLFPSGLIELVEGFADQHLRPLLNRYVPEFHGVLLAYRNPRVGEAPARASLTPESAMEDVVLLESINEYAVGFGWLTADVELFRPARGAWMEGIVNLQGEGHIGVVCWDMFNASIEAGRLPHGWRWIDLLSESRGESNRKGAGQTGGRADEETGEQTLEPLEAPDDDTAQILTTGYWLDETGTRIRGGAKLYFRIKHYEIGISGDYGYLSIEGTMLSEEDEKAKSVEEMEVLRRRRLKNGGLLRKELKRLPESSVTKLGADEIEDSEARHAPVRVPSRPRSNAE